MKKVPTVTLNETEFNNLLAGFWIAGFTPPSPIAHRKIVKLYESDLGETAVQFILKKSIPR